MHPDTDLTFCDSQWEVKTYKGHFIKINSPEELITHLYFEYYLPRLKQFPDLEIPTGWEGRFKLAGLLDSGGIDFKEARRATLLKKLEEHFGLETGIKDLEFWENLSKEFPECVYTGTAFRAVLAHESQIEASKLMKPGYSWSLSLDGIKNFIKLGTPTS